MRLLKMGEACKLANVCRDTMRSWCKDGIVKAFQIPAGERQHWRIVKSSLPMFASEDTLDKKARALIKRAGL